MRFFLSFLLAAAAALSAETPLVFPIPREMKTTGVAFAVNEQIVIASNKKLGRLLMAEFGDQYGLAVPFAASPVPAVQRAIVAGTYLDPQVKRLAAARGIEVSAKSPGPEGYVVDVRPEGVLVAGSDEAGAFYGVQTLRQMIRRNGKSVEIAGGTIRDWPHEPFRGIKMYLPGRDNIPYFKRFIRDFMAANKYNKLVLEMNAAMRFDRHPELNAGWLDFARDMDATRRDRPDGPHGAANSAHHDTADGGILEKEEVADLVRFVQDHHIEVIPEVPSMPHSYYLLTRHPELAEVPDQWPDTYCPLHPGSHKLLFDVMDEYIEVMKPRMIHAGKDEWRMPWGVCPRCRNRDYREVFIEDVRKTYDFLKSRGVRMAMWGDYLIEPLRGAGLTEMTSKTGWKYKRPGAITPEQVLKFIPKDILIFNWFWDEQYAATGQGEKTDISLSDWGFEQVYGNMNPYVQNYARRSERKGVIGGAPSSWAASTEANFGKDLLASYLGCANMMWSKTWPQVPELMRTVQARVESVRDRLKGQVAPSRLDPVMPVPLTGGADGAVMAEARKGAVSAGRLHFQVGAPITVGVKGAKDPEWPLQSSPVVIGEDATSLIFLHALVRPASSGQAYRTIYAFPETSDLVGWYEVVYEDGFVETIPLRYRVNILEWDRFRRDNSFAYCYEADAVDLSADPAKPVTFYALEWKNPRLGRSIKEVRLKGTSGFRRWDRNLIGTNGIMLGGLSIVKKRTFPPPQMPDIR